MNISVSASVSLSGLLPSPPGAGSRHPFELRAGPFFGGELQVVSLRGRERINDVYQYNVTFVTDQDPGVVTSALFGLPACLTIKSPGHDPRVIQGIASAVEAVGATGEERTTGRRRYRLEIVPTLWLLRHRRQTRIFQHKTLPEIVATVLGGVGIKDTDCRWRADKAAYPPLPFVYQRGETDWDFFRRVLASAGIFFFYEHASGFLDSLFGGAADAVAGAVGAAAGMFGGAVASVVGSVESAAGMVPVLNFSSQAGHTAAVASALGGVAADALQQGLGALGNALGGVAGSVVGAVAGAIEEPSDTLPFDDGMGADADYDRVYEFELKKTLCTKELRMLDRDVEAARSWVEVGSVPDASASLNLAAGLSGLMSGGLAGAAKSAVSFDVDAPTIAASMLRQEVYQADVDVWQDPAAPTPGPALRASASASVGIGSGGISASAQIGVGVPSLPGLSMGTSKVCRMAMELERVRRKYQRAAGRSDCRRMGAGYRFTLGNHPVGPVNGEYTITELDVVGVHPDFREEGDAVYRNRFRCIPSSAAPLPKRPKRRPKPGMEVARVVGYVGGETLPGLEASPCGYVKVRFRWDILDDHGAPHGSLQAGADDAYAVWLPVLQPWAGAGYGAQFIPREGMEVLVGFLEDQSERPVILGCLYSDANRPPWPARVDHQKVGIRSQSRPRNGGYSEVSIDDRANNEVVALRAQRDLDVTVVRESRMMVGADHIATVRGGSSTHVLRDATEHVDGSSATVIRGSSRTQVDGTLTATVGGTLTRQIGGSESVRITGSHNLVAGADARLVTKGSRTVTIGGDDIVTVGERRLVTVGTAGTSAAESNTYVWGANRLGAKGRLVIESETEVVLRCGTSELHVTPDGISLGGKTVAAVASQRLSLAGSGPALSLTDDVQLTSKTITLQSSAARLTLSDSAALTSSSVKLGKPAQSQPPSTQSSVSSPGTLHVQMVGPDHKPLANCKYLLELGGVTSEGTTDGTGAVTASPPPGVTTGRCTVWLADFPSGPRVTINIALEAIEPATDVPGAQKRLRNLGYYTGATTGTMNAHLRDALLVFQHTHGLDRTGLLDGPTTAKLAEVHP